jgi:hemolysin III
LKQNLRYEYSFKNIVGAHINTIKCPVSKQSSKEEFFNIMTHGLGLLGSIVGFVLLISISIVHGGRLQLFGCFVYGTTLVLLYAASTFYHAARCPKRKRFLQKVDHSCIYLLIAGSYTPFTLGPLRGTLGWTLLAAVWAIAIGGLLMKAYARSTPDWFNSLVYLGMGWMVIFVVKPLGQALSHNALLWFAAGGAAYSLGVIFYLWKKLPFNHGIWHLFVLAGSVCHYICVARYIA